MLHPWHFNRDMNLCHIHGLSYFLSFFFFCCQNPCLHGCSIPLRLELLFFYPMHTTMMHSSKALLQLSLLHRAQPCESSCISVSFFSLGGSLYNLLRAYLGGNRRSRGVQTHIWSGMRPESWDTLSQSGRKTNTGSLKVLLFNLPQVPQSGCQTRMKCFYSILCYYLLVSSGLDWITITGACPLLYASIC